MGRRGDKRRAKAKRRRERQPDVEGFQVGPLRVERHGKVVVSHVDPAHPDYAEFRKAMDEMADRLPQEAERLRTELRELLRPYDAFDVVTNLWLLNVPKDPETYRESTEPGLLAIPEVAAAIMIERKSRDGADPTAHIGSVLEEAQEKLNEFLRVQAFAHMEEARRRDPDDPAYAEIRAAARAHRLGVRGPSYPWQEHQTVLDLFDADETRDLARDAAGFSAREGLALAEATVSFGLARLVARAKEARAFAERLLEDDARARAGKSVVHPEHEQIVTQLATLGRRAAVERIHHLAIAWVGFAGGTTMQFSASELADYAQVSEAATTAFLDRFSVCFGDFEGHAWLPDLEDLRDRPLLTDGGRNYICISPHNLLWAVRSALESALKEKGGKSFQRYERHRAKVIETRAVNALAGALGAEWAHTGLFYEIEEGGERKRPELDGILRLDSAVFLVEVKASSMRPAARRGAPDALRDWLKDELAKAANQARRAREALFAEQPAPLFDSAGRRVELDLDGVEHVIEIVVTLEDLPGIAPQTWKLADAGLLPDDPVPWVISLHELEIICEIVERPAELVHYALRRQRLNDQRRVWAMDELDYFMHYLVSGLYWPNSDDEQTGPIQLASHTDELDAYYMHIRGERRKKAKRPGQKHQKSVQALLDCLGALDAPGRLDAALAILDVDTASRERVAGDLGRLRKQSAADGTPHDRSYFFDEFGITVLSAPPEAASVLPDRLREYCELKKHQMKVDRWVGFGVFRGPPEPVQVAVVFLERWQPDADLDQVVATLPSFGVEGDFDGRKLAAEARLPDPARTGS